MDWGGSAGSACIEMLFLEAADPAERIKLAAEAGYAAIEFWTHSNKDLVAIQSAVRAAGILVTGFVAEPDVSLNDPSNHESFLAALPASIAIAQSLGARFLYIQGGRILDGVPRLDQTKALIQVLTRAAHVLQGSGITLLLEPVSDTDKGFLTHAAEGFSIVAAVNRPEVRLLYDLFHAAVAAEDLRSTASGLVHLIGHVHVADFPGRGAPGTGRLDLTGDAAWLRAQGYTGLFGMEYVP